MISSELVENLRPFIIPITHCPEVDIGLGVPRKPVRVVAWNGNMRDIRLIQPETHLDVTEKMNAYAGRILSGLKDVDGFIMKSKSPSSGVYDVKIYPSTARSAALTRKGAGLFGARVLDMFAGTAIEDEGRLQDDRLRDNFLKRIFTSAAFRSMKKSGRAADLVAFHAANKLLFMSYHQGLMREMGRVTGSLKGGRLPAALVEYERLMIRLFVKPYKRSGVVNVLEHAFGYFKKDLSSEEKRHFLSELHAYRQGASPVQVPVSLLTSWIIRFRKPYLAGQTFFAPYPKEIVFPGKRKRRTK
jgi:uncharacterized protein YbgA (DUF1722 family)/uncharacterized protein YbbK (DUF523 family)